MAIIDLHRLPVIPAPDLRRVFGDRTLPVPYDPDAERLARVTRATGIQTRDLRLLRCALTDPGWCNEAETPPWVAPWPGNRALADTGGVVLDHRGVLPTDAARRGEDLGLWEHLWLAVGQRTLQGPGRERVLARAIAALVGALQQDLAGNEVRFAGAVDGLLGH